MASNPRAPWRPIPRRRRWSFGASHISGEGTRRTRKPGFLVTGAALLLVLLMPSPVGASGTTSVARASAATVDPGLVASQLLFRQELGFPTDASALAGAARSATASVSKAQFGLSLSPAEFADVNLRLQRQAAQGRLVGAVRSLPATTGGIWINQQDGGNYVVETLPGLDDSTKASLAALVPSGGRLVFQQANYSYTSLISFHDQIVRELRSAASSISHALVQMGLTPTGVSIIEDQNKVRVGLVQTPTDLTALTSAWNSAYASGDLPPFDAVEIASTGAPYLSSETHADSPGQMKSGSYIYETGNGHESCTSNLGAADNAGNRYLVTAGHCAAVGQQINNGIPNGGQNLGHVSDNSHKGGNTTPADVLAVHDRVAGFASPYAWALPAGRPPEVDTISYVEPYQAFSLHQIVCMNGASSYDDGTVHCGMITGFNDTRYDAASDGIPSADINTLIDANYYGCLGDSGALVGNGTEGDGIQSSEYGTPCSTSQVFSSLDAAQGVISQDIPGFHILTTQVNTPGTWSALQNEFGSKFCMDVAYDNSANGTTVWAWGPCNAGVAEQWSFIPSGPAGTYTVKRFAASTKCLDADANGPLDGARVQEWDCNGSAQQQWVVGQEGGNPDDMNVLNVRNTGCLDMNIAAPGGGYSAGTPLQTWQCLGAGQSNQLWFLSAGG